MKRFLALFYFLALVPNSRGKWPLRRVPGNPKSWSGSQGPWGEATAVPAPPPRGLCLAPPPSVGGGRAFRVSRGALTWLVGVRT